MQLTTDIYQRIAAARVFIDKNYHTSIDLDQIARQAFLSRFHFHRLFTRIYKKTPHQYMPQAKVLPEKGILGAGVITTTDCRAAYEELKAKGVQFKSEAKEQFYGIEAVMFDGCGNWFCVTQPKEM